MKRAPQVIDLHAHTLFSDGVLTPDELLDLAAAEGVGLLAVTDHDTADGLAQALAAGARTGVQVLCGVELTARHEGHALHLVSYLPGPPSEAFVSALAALKNARVERIRAMIANLNALGVYVETSAVDTVPGVVGRPHLADALVAAGHVASRSEAFDRYIGDDRPAFVPGGGLDAADAIELVTREGGVACLAHPGILRASTDELDRVLGALAGLGLAGIEVYRAEHTQGQRREYRWLADRYGLIPSGGSDFHGPGLGPRLGDTGSPRLPYETANRLLDRAKR